MPNNLGTMSPSVLLAKRTLDTLLETYPFLKYIGGDYSDETAEFGRSIIVQQPGTFTAGNYTRANGYAPQDAKQSEATLPIDKHKYVTYGFDDQERSSTAVPLIERFSQAAAAALGSSLVADLFALVTPGSFDHETVVATSAFSRKDVIDVGKALNSRKVSPVGRLAILNSDTYGKLLEDAVLVANPGSQSDAVRSGELGNVHGFRTSEFPALPATSNLTGLAIQPGGLLLATRLPMPPDNGTFQGQIETVTDEGSGLSLQVRTWYDPLKGLEYRTLTFMYGVAVGDPDRVQRIVSGATD